MSANVIQWSDKLKARSSEPLEQFLASVERRAYRSALLTTRKAADALDLVQDAMLQLVQHYSDKEEASWPLLFNRILHNKLMDWHRFQARERRWFWLTPAARDDEDEEDLVANIVDEQSENPAELLARARDIQSVLNALEGLPIRQRQAFLLRAWEGLDVAETAAAMGCGEGSVKTHYFRALQSLRSALGQQD